jgi:hypothetical protein
MRFANLRRSWSGEAFLRRRERRRPRAFASARVSARRPLRVEPPPLALLSKLTEEYPEIELADHDAGSA